MTQADSSTAQPAGLRGRTWRRFVYGPDTGLLDDLYVPMLASAVRYDRSCAYFSSSVLSAAARGFAGLIANLEALGPAAPRPAVRLVVNEELDPGDVRALQETGDASKLEEKLLKRFTTPRDRFERAPLEMLAWLVAQGLLEVRVGVMRQGQGILHAKYGIVTDSAGDSVVFAGSSNESWQGLRGNYDQVEVSTSWGDSDRHGWYAEQFNLVWKDKHPDVHTVSLPDAIRDKLLRLTPKRPPPPPPTSSRERQRAAMLWRYIVEAPYLPNGEAACDGTSPVTFWPHQSRVVADVVAAWPDGRLLCDEVGMGKTIEAIGVLRRLLAGRGVKRVLILPPAGLVRQWQAELREKGGLLFPRLEGVTRLVWPDGKTQQVDGVVEALRQDRLIASRELLRAEQHRAALLTSDQWDLVLMDEAHAARRRQAEEGEFNSVNLLLELLRELQLRRKARSIALLSATPMQTQPWEPWDLLAVLGEGGQWLAEFARVREFYEAMTLVAKGQCSPPAARRAAALVAGDPAFPPYQGLPAAGATLATLIAQRLQAAPPTERAKLARWLRRGSPLTRRMHRNTRQTLRRYYELGMLPSPPPTRVILDARFDYAVQAERDVYDAVTKYIEKRFTELEHERPGKGFVMTVYRRRASSSPFALDQSLSRRAEGLRRVVKGEAVDAETEQEAREAAEVAETDEADDRVRVTAAYPTDPKVAEKELAEVTSLLTRVRALGGQDSKLDRLYEQLHEVGLQDRALLVFTEYTDTVHYYYNESWDRSSSRRRSLRLRCER